MTGALNLFAHTWQCHSSSHSVPHTSRTCGGLSRYLSSNRVHPLPAKSQLSQTSPPRQQQNGLCRASLCQRLSLRSRSSSARRGAFGAQRVFASWGQDIEWKPAKISNTQTAATQLKKLVLDIGSLADGYKTAGQFLQIKVGDSKPGFFAIASAPDSNNQGLVEVLIKDGPPESAANLLCNMSTGGEVSVSPVMGKGFRMERAPASQHPTCLLFATGSGISPIKALIESDELQTHDRKDIRLFYGTKNTDTTAYRDLDDSWKAAGVETIHVYSDDDKGYVQDVFSQADTNFEPSKACAVMVGHKEMCEAVTKILESKGVAKEHILLNF